MAVERIRADRRESRDGQQLSNEQTPTEGAADLAGPARIAAEQFERAMTRINQVLRDMEHDPSRAAKELIDETRLLRKALENIYEERRRIRSLGLAGDGPGGILDLAAARDEIGRRLACLRAAGGGAELSGGAE
ncbi:hypothetical protein HUK65_15780 [Rhodobacteraceae bacterium 2376]|uniref:Uncharacterized protein n=1 Tax=Rhabdonatronobacter sediminivivens TaxID=2743469 RepID=A0A7Z0I2L9_9RHOB|nr:hypothetical protein [Rhabdonatronobacter sediminivivens]NYS26447.1 hypothetical protein [Rhabdonatronobacter sediminivivens]